MKGIRLFCGECKEIMQTRAYLLWMAAAWIFFLIKCGNVALAEQAGRLNDGFANDYAGVFTAEMFSVMALAAFFVSFYYGLRTGEEREKNPKKRVTKTVKSCAALVLLLMGSVFLMSLVPLGECSIYADRLGLQIDNLAYVKTLSMWVLPAVTVLAAAGLVLGKIAAPHYRGTLFQKIKNYLVCGVVVSFFTVMMTVKKGVDCCAKIFANSARRV